MRAMPGRPLGRQELDGVLLADVEGALWSTERLEACRVQNVPELDRIVVAVDPPAGAAASSDACGIVVAGVVMQGPVADWRVYVLEDASVKGESPNGWASAAIAAMDRHGADRLVAEVNQGGCDGRKPCAVNQPVGALSRGARHARQGCAGGACGSAL